MSDLKPCPYSTSVPAHVIKAAWVLRNWAESKGYFDKKGWQICGLTRFDNVTPEERIRDEKAKMLDEILKSANPVTIIGTLCEFSERLARLKKEAGV